MYLRSTFIMFFSHCDILLLRLIKLHFTIPLFLNYAGKFYVINFVICFVVKIYNSLKRGVRQWSSAIMTVTHEALQITLIKLLDSNFNVIDVYAT